ncbi:MAG: TonB-dependent receptor plug domain-containing protein [Flavobacteriales bacterium]
MKKIVILLVVLVNSFLAQSQIVTVSDMVTLEKIPGVIIEAEGVTAITTDANGKADITAFAGKSVVNFRMTGYEIATFSYVRIAELNNEIKLYQNSIFTDEVVVSASRFEEKQEDLAQQVQVISKNDLRFMNQQTTADVLQQTGNVMVQKSQAGGGSPIIRGLEANKVLMVVDGVRLNNAIYRGGHLQNIITLDNTIMEKVEIVYGPGSVVYGSDALGGVMHFYTRNPEFSNDGKLLFKGNAFVRTGTANNEKSGHVDFNLGGKKFSSLTSVTYSDFDDLRSGDLRDPYYNDFGRRYFYVERIGDKDSIIKNDNPNVQVGTAYKQYDLFQKFSFIQNKKVQHILNIQYSSSSDIPRYDRLSEGTIDSPVQSEWYYGPQKRLLTSYNLLLGNKNRAYDNARIILAYQDIEESRHNRGFGSSRRTERTENVGVLSLNADFQKQFGKNEFRYGVEITNNDVQSVAQREHVGTGEITFQNTRYPDGGSQMSSAAIYVTDSWEVSEKFIVNAGARFSNVSLESKIDSTNFAIGAIINGDTLDYYFLNGTTISQNNGAFNGNLGLVFKPGRDWNIAALFATGFRSPNVDDVGKLFEQPSGAILIPNPDLKPETSTNFDLRISKTIRKNVSLTGTGFYNQIKNLIAVDNATFTQTTVDTVLANVVTNVNKDEAYIYGFSGQLDARVNQNFSITSAINYTYGRIKGDSADTPLDHIPPVFGRTGFNLQLKKFKGEFFVMYSGWKRIHDYRLDAEDNEIYATAEGMPSWYTLNVRGQYQMNNYIQIQVACENLLNQHYRVFASGTSSAGRNLMVTLRARF